MKRRNAIAVAVLIGVLGTATPATAAHSGCGLLGLGKCAHTSIVRTPAPDPGGSEDTDVALPLAGPRTFGFNTQLSIGGHASPEAEVGYGRSIGATAQRYSASWRGLQPYESSPLLPEPGGPGSHYLRRLDALYAELLASGMRPIIVTGNAPVWATDYATCGMLDTRCKRLRNSWHMHPSRARLPDFARFAAALARRYPEAAIEPWNEPNVKPFWQPDTPDPHLFTALQCRAYRAIKALPDPNGVLSGGFAAFWTTKSDGSPDFEPYLNRAFAAGLGSCIDGFSVHMYPANQLELGAGTPFAEQFAIVRRQRQRYGDQTPIWVTETGSTSFPSSDSQRWGITEGQQADLNARLLNRLATMPDVRAVIFHTLRNDPLDHWAHHSNDPGYHYGFLYEDFEPKPVWCEFARKASLTSPGC